jgi:hypothetical protein
MASTAAICQPAEWSGRSTTQWPHSAGERVFQIFATEKLKAVTIWGEIKQLGIIQAITRITASEAQHTLVVIEADHETEAAGNSETRRES